MGCKPSHDGVKKIDVAILGQLSRREGRWCVNTSPWSGHKCSRLPVHPSIHPGPPSVNIYYVPGRVLDPTLNKLSSLPSQSLTPKGSENSGKQAEGPACFTSNQRLEARPAPKAAHPPTFPRHVTISLMIECVGSGVRPPGLPPQVPE